MTSLLLVIFAAVHPQFSGSWANCPSPAAVELELADFGTVLDASEVVELFAEGGELRLRLRDGKSNLRGELVLPKEGRCARLARAIAVALAGWETHPDPRPLELSLPAPPPAPTSADPVPVIQSESQLSLPSPNRRRLEWVVGAGFLGSLSDSRLAPAAMASVSVRNPRAPWGLQLRGTLEGDRSFTLGPGSVRWQRYALGLAPSYQLELSSFLLQFEVDGLVALLHAGASSYSQDRSTNSPDFGLGPGFTVSLATGSWKPWLGFWVIDWPFAQQVQIRGTALQQDVPQLELWASLGMAWNLP